MRGDMGQDTEKRRKQEKILASVKDLSIEFTDRGVYGEVVKKISFPIYEGEILGVLLPDKVELQVVECEPAVKGDTATSASKMAKLETGLEIRVPLFINQDEMIVVSTSDGKYSGRA